MNYYYEKNQSMDYGNSMPGAFLYFTWNNFEIPFAPWTKTSETKAIITDIALGYGPKGMGFSQIITIQYQVGDSTYVEKKKLPQRIGKKEVGTQVLIEYSEQNPTTFEIKGFYKK